MEIGNVTFIKTDAWIFDSYSKCLNIFWTVIRSTQSLSHCTHMTNIMNSSAKKGKTRRLSLNEPDLDSIIDRAQRRLVNPYRRTESVKSLKTQWTQETSTSDSESSVSSISLSVAIQDDEEDRWFSDSDPVQRQGRFRSQVVPTMESLLNTAVNKSSNRKKKKKKSKLPNAAAAPPRRRRASSTEVLERRSKGFRDFAMDNEKKSLENKKGSAKNTARPALSDTRKKTGTDNALMDMFSSQVLLNPEKSPPKQLSTSRSSEDLLGLFQVQNNNATGTPKSASSAAASRRRRSTVREFEDIDERELSNTNLDVKVDPSLLMAEAIPHSDEGGVESNNNEDSNKKSKKKKKRKDKKSGSGSTASKRKTPPAAQVRRKSFEAEDAMDPSKHASSSSNNNNNGTKKKLSFGPSRSSDSLFPSLTRSESARFKNSGNAWLTGRYMQNDTWGGEDEAKSEELVERPSVAKLSGSALKRSKSTDDQPKLAADSEQQGTSSSNNPSSTALWPLPALKPSTRDPRASLRNRFTRTSSVPMFKVGESNPRAQAIERTIEREISRRSLPDEDTGNNNFAYSNTTILPTFDIPTIHPRSRIMERAYSQRDIHSADECDDLLKDDANSDDDDEDDNGGVTMSLLGGGRTDRFDHFGSGAASDSDNDDDDDDDDDDDEDGDDQGKATSMLKYLKNRRRSSGRGRSTDLGSSSHSQKKRTGSSDSTAKRIGRAFLGRATSLRFQQELDASKHKETNRRRRHSLTEGEPPKKATGVGFLKLECDDFSQGALDLSDDEDDDNNNKTPVSRNEAAVGKPSKRSNRSPSRKQERPDSVPPSRTISDDSNANTSFRSTKSDSSDVRSTSHKSERSKKKKKKSSKKPKSERYESNFERFMELNKNSKGDSNRLSSSKSAVSKSRSVATSRYRSKSRKSTSKEFGRSESDDYMLSKSDDELFCDQKDRKKKKKKSRERDDKSERSKRKKKDTGLSMSTRETRAEREELRQSRRRRSIEEKMSKAETGPTTDRDPLSKSDRRR